MPSSESLLRAGTAEAWVMAPLPVLDRLRALEPAPALRQAAGSREPKMPEAASTEQYCLQSLTPWCRYLRPCARRR